MIFISINSAKRKAFELLRTAMLQEGKVAIAKTVIGIREKLLALIATDSGILIETLFFADEIRQAPKKPARPELKEEELDMAKSLISTMVQEFEPEKYHDEYQTRIWEIIRQKIQGKEIVTPQAEQPDNIIDLMEAPISRYIEERGRDFFNMTGAHGLEGIVAKKKDSRYYFDRRTKDWIKIKNMEDDDFMICGYIYKENNMVSLVLGQYEGKSKWRIPAAHFQGHPGG